MPALIGVILKAFVLIINIKGDKCKGKSVTLQWLVRKMDSAW